MTFSFLSRLWAACLRSITIAWAYALIAAGLTLDALPYATDLLNAPEIQTVITDYAGPHASHWLKAIGVITALTRMRSLWRDTRHAPWKGSA
jgi:hypothetical protein